MNRSEILVLAAFLGVVAAGAWVVLGREAVPAPAPTSTATRTVEQQARDLLFEQLRPVRLSNCTLERFGERHDGGYLLCANLLTSVKSAYSYGISGYDQWGCDVSRRLKVRVHQYDCFNTTRPSCADGDPLFHAECVAGYPFTDEAGRVFDSVQTQIEKNGDAGKQLVMKMDVEGAEVDSILHMPDATLDRFDQIAIELHDFDHAQDVTKLIAAVSRLRKFFHVAHLHYNNFSCAPGLEPFPAWAIEALFVSKRIGVVDQTGGAVTLPNPADSSNNPTMPDCQAGSRR
jgi:hypothetical protein